METMRHANMHCVEPQMVVRSVELPMFLPWVGWVCLRTFTLSRTCSKKDVLVEACSEDSRENSESTCFVVRAAILEVVLSGVAKIPGSRFSTRDVYHHTHSSLFHCLAPGNLSAEVVTSRPSLLFNIRKVTFFVLSNLIIEPRRG